ncbi:MAG: hypothetical protein QXX41_08955 [Nitrososphaerota archaeon]
MLKHVNCRLKAETLNYIEILADAFDLPRSYVIRRLLEIAVDLHKQGVFEFPEGTVTAQRE